MTLLVTGGAGFIGSNFVINWLKNIDEPIVNLDKLTYAGNLEHLASLANDPRHIFVHGDISDELLLFDLLTKYRIRAVIHFAAESHVDRSIASPDVFIETNIVGTCCLLKATLRYWQALDEVLQRYFRFIHISTDEVFGSLEPNAAAFTETASYRPNNPYAASKAGADHFVRAYHMTYGLPAVVIHSSNNYGPRQHMEKFIPRMIYCAINRQKLTLYGDGQQIRDWLHVDDHCLAIMKILEQGQVGEVYNIGGGNEKTNWDVVLFICKYLDHKRPMQEHSYCSLVGFVKDREGHDRRYAIDRSKLLKQLKWQARYSFEEGLAKTIDWYLGNSLGSL